MNMDQGTTQKDREGERQGGRQGKVERRRRVHELRKNIGVKQPFQRLCAYTQGKTTATEPAGQRICCMGPLPAGPVQSAALGSVALGADPGRGTEVMDPTLFTAWWWRRRLADTAAPPSGRFSDVARLSPGDGTFMDFLSSGVQAVHGFVVHWR